MGHVPHAGVIVTPGAARSSGRVRSRPWRTGCVSCRVLR